MSNCESNSAYGVVLFQSVHGALAAEALLVAAKIEHKLIPVPRTLSSNCGFCVRFFLSDKNIVESLLDKTKLGIDRIVQLPPPR